MTKMISSAARMRWVKNCRFSTCLICWYKTITLYLGNINSMRVFCFAGSDSFHRTILKDSKWTLLLSSLAIGVLQVTLTRSIPSWLLRSNSIGPSLWKFMWNSLKVSPWHSLFQFWTSKSLIFMKRYNHLNHLLGTYFFGGLGIRLPVIMADTQILIPVPASFFTLKLSSLKVEERFTSMLWF